MEEKVRTKRVLRHFCDHCKRGGFQKHSMQRHENACFRNPKRWCPICADAALEQQPMEKLLAAFPDPENLTALRDLTQGCPACIVATIIQARHMKTVCVGEGEDIDVRVMVDFNYKTELAEFNNEPGRKHLGWQNNIY